MSYFRLLVLVFVFFPVIVNANNSLVSVEVLSAWLIIWTPENLNIWSVSPWNDKEVNFTDYFWIEDLRWTNTGHYTTIQCDWLYGPSDAIITWVQLSWATVDMIAGKPNNTLIYSNLSSRTDVTEPKLYLYRNNNVSNNWAINRYWNKPAIKITVPSWVPAGSYKWKITYTLYDMSFNY